MRKFIKPSCLGDADTPEKLLRMNIEDLCADLASVIRSLMRKFIKPSCLGDADTPEKLLRMNIEDFLLI